VLWQALQYKMAFSIIFPLVLRPFARIPGQNGVPVSFRCEPYPSPAAPSPYLS
jgi:hypothetical protein